MECLQNYIGIKGCGWTPPVQPEPEVDGETLEPVFSGLYVNDLPGISLKSLEQTADADMKNFLGVWEVAQRRALLKMGIGLRAKLNSVHNITDRSIISCLTCHNKSAYGPALQYLIGSELMAERLASDRLNWTTVNKDRAEALRAEYYAEYEVFFSDGFLAMDMVSGDCLAGECIETNPTHIFFRENLP